MLKKAKNIKQLCKNIHFLKISKGLISSIPWLGPIIAEYIPDNKNPNKYYALDSKDAADLLDFINNNRFIQKKNIWYSEDKETFFVLYGNVCEQSSCIDLQHNYIYITFCYPFDDINYFFSLEQNNFNISILKKTTTYICLHIPKIYPEIKIRWIAIGRGAS